MKLYRVMCRAELDDLRQCGRFRSIPGRLTVKWFAERLEDAVAWGRQFEEWDGIPHDCFVMIDVPDGLAAEFDLQGRRDGIGPARCAEIDQLAGVVWVEVTP